MPARENAALYARDYERFWSPVIRTMAEGVLPGLPLGGARRILDIGTGCGALEPALRAAAPQATVVGIDRSLEMTRLAASRGVLAVVMDAACLGLPDSSFDAALAAFMLFFAPDPIGVLREARRVLRPMGILATVTWGEDSYAPAELIWEEELRAAGAPARPQHPSSDRVDTPAKMEQICIEAGFHPRRTWQDSCEHCFDREALLELKSAPGLAHRFHDLPRARRQRVVRRARERFASLDPQGFVWRARVVYCIAAGVWISPSS